MAVEVSSLKATVGADIAPLQAGLRRADRMIGQFAQGLQQAVATGLGFAGAQVAMNIFARAVDAARGATISFNAQMEQLQVSFAVLLKSEDRAIQLMRDLQQFAARTPFELPQLTQAAQGFLNARFAMEEIIPLLTAVGDMAAGSAEKIQRMTLALTQIAAKGRVQGDELLQLQEAGVSTVAVLEQVGQRTGKSMAQVREAMSKGQIGARQFIDAFMEVSRRDMGGMMERQAQTFNGAMSTITDNLRQFSATAFKPVFDRLREAAIRFANFSSDDSFETWAQRIAAHVEIVLRGLGVLATGFQSALTSIARIVLSLGTIILRGLAALNPFARHSPSLIEQMREGYGTVIPEILTVFQATTERVLAQTGQAFERFQTAAAGGIARATAAATAETEKQVALLGTGAVAAYRAATAALEGLSAAQREAEAAIRAAEEAIKEQEAALRPLEAAYAAASKRVDEVGKALDAARQRLSQWQQAILPGTKAFEQAMFDAEQAARRLELQIVNFKLGGALEAASRRVERLRDALGRARDMLNQFTQAALVGTGAYQDALFENDQAIKQLQLRLTEMQLGGASEEELAGLREQIERLRLEGDRIRLKESLELDPQRRALEKLASTAKELTFEQARAGIIKWRAETDRLEGALRRAERVEQRRREELNRLQRQLEQVRLEAERTRLKWEIDTAPWERLFKTITDKRVEETGERIAAGLREASADVDRLTAEFDAAKVAQEAAAAAVQAQRDRIAEMRLQLEPLRDRWQEVNEQARLYKEKLDEILARARELDEAARKAAGGGEGPEGGAIGGVQTAPPWAKKADQWAKEQTSAFDAMMAEMEPNLTRLQGLVNDLNKPLVDLANNLSSLAGTGQTLAAAWAGFADAWDRSVVTPLKWLDYWWYRDGERLFKAFQADVLGAFQAVADGSPEKLATILRVLLTWAGQVLIFIVEHTAEWVAQFLGWVIPMLPKLALALGAIIVEMVRWFIFEAQPAIAVQLAKWALAFLQWNIEVLNKLGGELDKILMDLTQWVIEVALPQIKTKLGEWASAFWGWVQGASDELFKKLQELADNVLTWAGKVGNAIIDGIKKGIDDKKEELFSALRRLAESALGAAKRVLGISSPSEEYQDEVGSQIVLGMIAGIKEHAQALLDTVVDVLAPPLQAATDLAEALAARIQDRLRPQLVGVRLDTADWGRLLAEEMQPLFDQLIEVTLPAMTDGFDDLRRSIRRAEAAARDLKDALKGLPGGSPGGGDGGSQPSSMTVNADIDIDARGQDVCGVGQAVRDGLEAAMLGRRGIAGVVGT